MASFGIAAAQLEHHENACSSSSTLSSSSGPPTRVFAAQRTLPAQALRARLSSGAAPPAWAMFLPAGHVEGLKDRISGLSSACSSSPSTSSGCAGALEAAQVWRLSQDSRGTRAVQQALEDAESNEERETIAAGLQGCVWAAMQDLHANHVVQKCVATLRPAACQFIFDELAGARFEEFVGVAAAARHKYGCRVVQRLVEHCPAEQTWELGEGLLREASAIARHPYGNYVVQHFLLHGAEHQRKRLEDLLEAEVSVLGRDAHGSAVLAGAFLVGMGAFCPRLAARMLQEPGLLVAMAGMRHGHVAVMKLLEQVTGVELEEARALLTETRGVLEESKFGRAVVALLDQQPSV